MFPSLALNWRYSPLPPSLSLCSTGCATCPLAAMPRSAKTSRCFQDLSVQANIIRDVEQGVKREEVMAKYGLKHQSNITRIMGRKDKIMARISSGLDVKKKLIRKTMFPEVEKELERFVVNANSSEGPLMRCILKEQATKIAADLSIANFKASDGWLSGFEKRNNIACVTVHGDAGHVSDATVACWEAKLPLLLSPFSPDDVFNCDELGLFFKLLPEKTHAKKGSKCAKGKDSKVRVTVLLGANMTGTEKLELLVIGKSQSPHCFKPFLRSGKRLPLAYAANKKAWMTGEIFVDYLSKLNNKMRAQGRRILLLVDNCPAHPKDVRLSNVKLEFLPKNTTSVLQPCDQGIIRSFKCHYRKLLIKHVLLRMQEKGVTASQVPIDILQAMRWSKRAWEAVTQSTIANCFRKAGVKIDGDATVTATADEQENPDDGSACLVSELLPQDVALSDYVAVDDDLIVSGDTVEREREESETEIEDEADDEEDVIPKPTKAEALAAFHVLQRYNDYESFVEQRVVDRMESALLKHAMETKVQTKITDFFPLSS